MANKRLRDLTTLTPAGTDELALDRAALAEVGKATVASILQNAARIVDEGSNVLALKSGSNPQAFYLYNNEITPGVDVERGGMKWVGGTLNIFTETLGTGLWSNGHLRIDASNIEIYSRRPGNPKINFDQNGIRFARYGEEIQIAGNIIEVSGTNSTTTNAVNKVRLLVRDAGGGKRKLSAIFPTGAPVDIVTEP